MLAAREAGLRGNGGRTFRSDISARPERGFSR